MDQISDGCRLCLDPFGERFTTINNPQLKDQMEKVFYFPIDPKQGFCSSVCQSCSYAISEFYQYSEKVRQNQELLHGNLTNCDPTIDSKIILESVQVPTVSDSLCSQTTENDCEPRDEVSEEKGISLTVLPATIEDACDLKCVFSGEEHVLTLDSKITLESVKIETLSDSGLPESPKDDCKAESPSEKSQTEQKRRKRKSRKTKEERDEEDQLFNKHFRMICDVCGTSAETFTALRSHYKQEHNQHNGYVVCCNKPLTRRYALLDHIEYHANPGVFSCELCGHKLKTKHSLNIHKYHKHPKPGPFKCDLCPKSFAKKAAVAKHMEFRHIKVKCPECKKMLASQNSLRSHMTVMHSGKERTIVCDTCGKRFLSKHHFDQHKKMHMGIEAPKFQCEICQRWLMSEQSLRNHITWVHAASTQESQCDICLQQYPHPRALYDHKRITHAEAKHVCEFCDKKFKKARSLLEHRTVHTGEVLYSCQFCGTPNTRRRSLNRHIKVKHPKEWAKMQGVAVGVE